MRALGFEPKKEEIKKMIQDIDKDGTGIFFLYEKENLLAFSRKYLFGKTGSQCLHQSSGNVHTTK